MSAPAIRAVLADDHRILREGIRMLLDQGGGVPPIQVVGEAESGPAAVAMLTQLRPEIAVLDLALPGLPGLEVCRAARSLGVRVVILTMHVSAEHVRQARAAGADGYVVKGSGVSELAVAIRTAVAGSAGSFPDPTEDPLSKLTLREREVLVQVARGRGNREIAGQLGISVHTVNTHRVHLMEKLGVHDAVALTRLTMSLGLLS